MDETIQEETDAQLREATEEGDMEHLTQRTHVQGRLAHDTDEELVRHLRDTETPLPEIQDRWGNRFTFIGYGGGEYYRLSRQPVWMIRSLLQGGPPQDDPTHRPEHQAE